MLGIALSTSACDGERCDITKRTPEGVELYDPKAVVDECDAINRTQHEAHDDLITCFVIPEDDDDNVRTMETSCHDSDFMETLNRTFPEITDDSQRFCIGHGGANIKCD